MTEELTVPQRNKAHELLELIKAKKPFHNENGYSADPISDGKYVVRHARYGGPIFVYLEAIDRWYEHEVHHNDPWRDVAPHVILSYHEIRPFITVALNPVELFDKHGMTELAKDGLLFINRRTIARITK